MDFRTASSAFGLFVLSLTNLSADSVKKEQAEPKPMGVTMQPTNVITPPVGPAVSGCCDFFMTADFIYWRTTYDGMGYALSGIAHPDPVISRPALTSFTGKGFIKFPDFDFQPGFKLGAGLKFAHDGWDLYANYTWLNPGTTKATAKETDEQGMLFSTQADFVIGGPEILRAKNHFRQSFNTLDLELGRNFFLSRFMSLRPYFGLKLSRIHQHQRTNYTPTDLSSSDAGTTFTITTLIEKRNIKFWGIGIRGGISPVWYFMKGFGLYGNLALSGMWSYYKTLVNSQYDATIATATTTSFQRGTVAQNTIGSSHTITPVIELGLGLTYTFTCCNDYAFTFSGGWEEQIWINFAGNDFFGNFSNGNMTLQGLTVKAGVEF